MVWALDEERRSDDAATHSQADRWANILRHEEQRQKCLQKEKTPEPSQNLLIL